jgi:hypothetical protein
VSAATRRATTGITIDYIHAVERPTENLLMLRRFERIVSQMDTDIFHIRVHLCLSVFICVAEIRGMLIHSCGYERIEIEIVYRVVLGWMRRQHSFLGKRLPIEQHYFRQRKAPAFLHAPMVQRQSLAQPNAPRDRRT